MPGLYVHILCLLFVSDYQKWEIKPLGVGYSIQMVGVLIPFTEILAIVC